MATFTIDTSEQRQVLDITQQIQEYVRIEEGSIVLQLLHTTAALTTADLDPGTDKDMLEAFWDMIPQPSGGFRHPHDPNHAPAHLLASLIGPSLNLVVSHGEIQLGTWQRIVLIEFDGPRSRNFVMRQAAAEV